MNHPFIKLLLCSTSTTDKIRSLEQAIAAKKRTHSEINDEPIYLSLLKQLKTLTPQPTSLIDTLKCLGNYDDSFEQAKPSLLVLTAAWANFFEDTFSEESNPLALVPLCLSTFDSESEFAGFILFCFNKNLPILESGFLHKFILTYYPLGSGVENTYALLNAQNSEENALQNWLISLGKFDAELHSLSISLLGKNQTNLEKIRCTSYELTVTSENWSKLYHTFAIPFVLFAIVYEKKIANHVMDQTRNMLTKLINQQIKSMENPFLLIENVISEKNEIYKRIYLSLTEEKAKKLLLNNTHSIWIALADYPYEINSELEATCVARMKEKSLKTLVEIEAALKCVDKLRESFFIGESLLNIILTNESLTSQIGAPLSMNVLAYLAKISSALTSIIKSEWVNLNTKMEENARLWNMDYFKLQNELPMHHCKAIWLAALGEKNSFTGNKYDFTTWFINQQLDHVDTSQHPTERPEEPNVQQPLMYIRTPAEKIELVKNCLQSIEPENYNPSDYQSLRQRILIEYTLRSNRTPIIMDVILPLLNSDYLNWQRALLNIQNYINYIITTRNQPLLLETLNFLSEKERVALIKKKYQNGLTILHYFADSTILITILNQLPKKDLLSVICEKNNENESLLDYSRTYLDENKSSLSIVEILECLPITDRITAVMEKIKSGKSLLPEKEISSPLNMNKYFTYLENVLMSLPEHTRLEALLQKDKIGNTSINIIATDSSDIDPDFFNAVKIMLKLLPINHRILLVNSTNHLGLTLLQQACRDPKILNELMNVLGKKEKIAAIFAKNSQGSSSLLCAISACSMENIFQRNAPNPATAKPYLDSLKMLLKFLPKDELINSSNRMLFDNGFTLLSYAATCHDILKAVLNILSKSERTYVLTKINPSGLTLLQEGYNSPLAIKNILELLDPNDRLSFILIKNKHNYTLLSYIINSPENLKLVLNYLPIKDRLQAIQEKYDGSISLLEFATKNYPISIITILEQLTKHDRYIAIQETFSDGGTLLHHQNILHSHVYLKSILMQIHKDNRLAAIQAKNSDGDAVVLLAAQKPKCIEVIFELLPLPKRLEAKNTQNTSGYTLFNYATVSDSFDSVKTILKFFPKKDYVALLQEENYNGCTFLKNLHMVHSQFIPQLIDLLPEDDRLKVKHSLEPDDIEEKCQFQP